MDEKEKSLALAKLMGWEIMEDNKVIVNGWHQVFCPYDVRNGVSQFGALFLEFPQVLEDGYLNGIASFEPTQENILDEILRMNGIEA